MVSDNGDGSNGRDQSNTRLIVTIVIATIVISTYWWTFYHAGYQSGQNERKANVEAAHYAADTADQINGKCGAQTGDSARECIAEIVKAERESQRDESDLAAQWEAADWAKWAGVAALAQLIATIIGLYFLKGTLDATWKAVKDTSDATKAMNEANRIAKNSTRPWLQIEIMMTDDLKIRDGHVVINYRVIVHNVGEGIADIVKIETRHMNGIDEVHSEVPLMFDQPWRGERIFEKLGKNMNYWQPNCWKFALSEIRDVRLQERAIFIPAILVDVRYVWRETEAVFQTAKAYLVMCNKGDVKATVVYLDELPIARNDLLNMSQPESARMT